MKVLKNLGSLKFTMNILLALAAASVLGTLITQNQSASFYAEHYGKNWARLILFLQVDDFYQSFVYSAMLFCLGLNLLICVINSFKKKIFKSGKSLGLLLIHLSILLIFAAALISKFTRYAEHVTLAAGEKIVLPGLETDVSFEKFKIDYYPDTDNVRDYRSDFSAESGGGKKKNFTLRVNHPAAFSRYVFYQSGFEPRAILKLSVLHAGNKIWEGRLEQGQRVKILEDKNLSLEIGDFIPDAVIEKNKIMLRSYRIKDAALLVNVYKNEELIDQSWISNSAELDAAFKNESALFDFAIEGLEIDFSTIVQVVRDAGVPWVWSGFITLLCGLAIFLFNPSQKSGPRDE